VPSPLIKKLVSKSCTDAYMGLGLRRPPAAKQSPPRTRRAAVVKEIRRVSQNVCRQSQTFQAADYSLPVEMWSRWPRSKVVWELLALQPSHATGCQKLQIQITLLA